MVRIGALLLFLSPTDYCIGQSVAVSNLDTLISQAKQSIKIGDFGRAKELGLKAHSKSKRADQKKQAESALVLANAFNASNNFDVAANYYEEALELSDVVGDSSLLAKTLVTYGAARIRQQQFEDGERNVHVAIKMFERQGDTKNLIHAFEYLGFSAYLRGKFNDALIEFRRAFDSSLTYKDTLLVSLMSHNIAQCHVKLEQWSEAAEWERKAIKARMELGHDHYVNHYYSFLVEINVADSNLGGLLEDEINYLRYYDDSTGMNLDQIAVQDQIELHENVQLLTQANAGKLNGTLQKLWEVQRERWILLVILSCLLALSTGLLWQWRRNASALKATREAQRTQKVVTTVSEEAARRLAALDRYDDIQHLLSQTSNPLHQACYELLTRNYSNAHIGSIIGRDNTTIGRYMSEIAEQIGVDKHRLKEEALEIGHLVWKVHH